MFGTLVALQLSQEARATSPGVLAWVASGLAVLDVIAGIALLVWPIVGASK